MLRQKFKRLLRNLTLTQRIYTCSMFNVYVMSVDWPALKILWTQLTVISTGITTFGSLPGVARHFFPVDCRITADSRYQHEPISVCQLQPNSKIFLIIDSFQGWSETETVFSARNQLKKNVNISKSLAFWIFVFCKNNVTFDNVLSSASFYNEKFVTSNIHLW
jgi:hypothetical protein